jgi:hypothetical protein
LEINNSVFNNLCEKPEYKELKEFLEKIECKESVYELNESIKCYIHAIVVKKLKISEIKNYLKERM